MILNPSNYQFEPFDLEKALAGKPLAATFDNNGTITYKLVEQFYRESSDFALYKVLIESTYYTFNSDGVGTVVVGERASAEEVDSQLWMCKGIIDDTGSSQNPGDVIPYTPSGGDTEYFYIPSLNFRETVAVHALNSIISHYNNPIGYNTASIKLMITKAFEFAVEFTNQALDFRKKDEEAGITPGGETIIPDTPEVAVLKEIKSAFIGGTEQNPIKLIDQVVAIKNSNEALKNSTEELKDAMYVEEGNDTISITKKVAAVANAITTGDANIVSALGTTNTRLGAIASNTSDTNDKLDVANGKLAEIDSNTENIQVTAELDDSDIIYALKGNNNKSVVDAVLYIDNISELTSIVSNTAASASHAASIDSKIPNPNP